ncbi:MAG: response regulator transcription factor [Clostridia bacterium]|nr:response regulator transcription factor [Clostridia bacterium]
MKIAICEDEKVIAEEIAVQVKNYVNESNLEADIDIYNDIDKFSSAASVYDLVLLDIVFDGKTGIDAARELRNRGLKTTIIFITAYNEYVYEGYEVGAFRFLLKPIDELALKQAITSFITAYKEKAYIIVPINKKTLNISLEKVMYIEASEKYSIVRCLDETYQSSKSISDYQAEIQSMRFFRTHRRFLVNMKYITEIEGSVITLSNGEKVEISRRNIANFNKCYMNFLKYSI